MRRRAAILPLALLFLFVLGGTGTNTARGQLISPGRLTEAHKDLEGITGCTNCHALGNKGIQNTLCLSCHTPLQSLIERNEGYHAGVADRNCASCHKEHFGRTFKAVNWDTARFDHDATGYPLTGRHLDLTCSACHTPAYLTDEEVIAFKSRYLALDHTYLGLGSVCENCHESDSPHESQFIDRSCSDCHTPADWSDMAQFDHDRTRYPLLGRHIEVACASCHPPAETADGARAIYSGLSFEQCTGCHEDVHDGRLGAACSGCHGEQGWHRFSVFPEQSFPHEETGFALTGRHAAAACSACHDPVRAGEADGIAITFAPATRSYTYPHPGGGECLSCHIDYHDRVFLASAGGAACDNCHTTREWLPAGYDVARHNRESRFALTGAHRATPCFGCHRTGDAGELQFVFEDTGCASCHEPDNPHGDEFADVTGITRCRECHTTEAWSGEASFDHDETGFPLTGAHLATACSDCHTPPPTNMRQPAERRFDGLDSGCASCHADDDPHQGQFAGSAIGGECSACHDTNAFLLSGFDHDRTRFPLDGSHADVACHACHTTETSPAGEPFTRFRPLEITCESCHGNDR